MADSSSEALIVVEDMQVYDVNQIIIQFTGFPQNAKQQLQSFSRCNSVSGKIPGIRYQFIPNYFSFL